jgi:hypothetical protein
MRTLGSLDLRTSGRASSAGAWSDFTCHLGDDDALGTDVALLHAVPDDTGPRRHPGCLLVELVLLAFPPHSECEANVASAYR